MSLVSSEWSESSEVVPEPADTWLKPLDDPTLDIAVKVRVDAPHVTPWRGAVKDTIDGTREVRKAAHLKRRGSITFLPYTFADRQTLLDVLKHDGVVLLQLKPDVTTGENIYVEFVDDIGAGRLANIPLDYREVTVNWVEVER